MDSNSVHLHEVPFHGRTENEKGAMVPRTSWSNVAVRLGRGEVKLNMKDFLQTVRHLALTVF